MKNLSVVIPAYNEEESIGEVIIELKHLLNTTVSNYEIIVIDDGSTDKTKEIAEDTGAKVISHPINIGYGKAILTGIEFSQYEYIVTIDADGSYPVKELPKLLQEIEKFDLVIAARTGKEFWGTFLKYPARLIFLWLAEFTVGEKIPDVNSGFRVFKKSAFKKLSLPLLCRGFSFSTTMTLSFMLAGSFVKFVPITYLPRKGHSKVKYLKDTLRTLQAMAEIITFFNPLKIVLLLSFLPLSGTIFFFFLYLWKKTSYFLIIFIISLYFAILFFICGLILDLLRMNREWKK